MPTPSPDEYERLRKLAKEHAKRSRRIETFVLGVIVALSLTGVLDLTWWQTTALCCVALVALQIVMNGLMGKKIREGILADE